jgi:uncharacterized protein YkwD
MGGKSLFLSRYIYLALFATLSLIMVFSSGCKALTLNIKCQPEKLNKTRTSEISRLFIHPGKNLTGLMKTNIKVKGLISEGPAIGPGDNGPSHLFNNINDRINKYSKNISGINGSGESGNADTSQGKESFQETNSGSGATEAGETGKQEDDAEIVSSTDIRESVTEIINSTRNDAGSISLLLDSSLCLVAQQRSDDMAARDYFSHTTPEGKNIYNFLAENGIAYSTAGENIQYCSPPSMASAGLFFNTWMDSDIHRANILNGGFSRIGIGTSSNSNNFYIVLVFTG